MNVLAVNVKVQQTVPRPRPTTCASVPVGAAFRTYTTGGGDGPREAAGGQGAHRTDGTEAVLDLRPGRGEEDPLSQAREVPAVSLVRDRGLARVAPVGVILAVVRVLLRLERRRLERGI